jgi:DNA-binding PadR family transcriptional regulator
MQYIELKYKYYYVDINLGNPMSVEDTEKTTRQWLKEAQKGYIRVAVLILLSKKPSHGYEIMKEIKDRTKGFWRPTAGGVYPILRDLEKAGYIKGEWLTQKNRRTKAYEITEAGGLILKHAIVKQSEIANNMNALFQEFASDVLNIESKKLPMPIMPTPFSAFLEEKNEEAENLEQKCKHLKYTIEMLQRELQSISKRTAKAKKIG